MKMRYTYVEESPYNPGKWLIYFKNGLMPFEPCVGCRHVLGARLMGLNYADYLRLCRDEYGAEIQGKGQKYPTPYFTSEASAERLAAQFENRIYTLLN